MIRFIAYAITSGSCHQFNKEYLISNHATKVLRGIRQIEGKRNWKEEIELMNTLSTSAKQRSRIIVLLVGAILVVLTQTAISPCSTRYYA